MNLRLLLVLAVVVAAIGGGAYYFGQERKALQSETYQSAPLIAGIEGRINDVDTARLESQEGGVLTLKRGEKGWTIQEHFDYPANSERVTELLKRVAELTTIEPKTRKPKNHKRLNLDDPSGEKSLATRITLKAGTETIADLVVGLNRPEAHGGGAFVRLWGDDQAWLTKGEFKPKRRTIDMIDRNIVNIDGRKVRSARIRHPAPQASRGQTGVGTPAAAEMIAIAKDTPDQENYTLGAVIPEGMQPKPAHELAAAARIGDFLIFEEVRPASQIKMNSPVVGVYDTFDGVRLILGAQAQSDGETWVTVGVEAAPRWPGLDAFLEANKGKDSEAGRIADQFKTPDEVAAEIGEWTRKTKGWAYKLTDYKTKRLTTTIADLVEAPKPQPQHK